ncbi:MAG: 50S ribosomal protein L7/L12 [candidate division Zixibacteria bacterium]|nr:50S ribosomal protein L7/L12 [candidate division Zixibacteria bacterium]MBU2626796.1 50S ribosomal protein L7/L12 [candidate division Zixibacteria bacterium]
MTVAEDAVGQIIDLIEKMTVLELADLSKQLQDKFGVSAAMPVAVAAAGGPAEAAVEEQTEFDVVLTAVGDKKIQVIKVVRELTSLGLKEAKEVVDGYPSNIKESVTRDEAEAAKAKLEEVGAQIEIK